MLDVLHSERFIDQSPAEVHATLLEEQIDYRVYCYLMTSDDSQLKRPGFDEPLSWPGDRLEKAP